MIATPSQALIATVKIHLLFKLTSVPPGIVEMGKGILEVVKLVIQDSSNILLFDPQ